MAKAIFLEGIDGTGKSTLVEKLKDYLVSKGEKVLTLREPGGSAYYQAIREHIHFSDLERTALSDMLTCAGGIAENIRQTKKALADGTWVITDRCYISNAVYQIAQGLDPEVAHEINKLAVGDFTYHVGIVLDVPLTVAEQRLLTIGKKKDRWETMGEQYFATIRDLYLQIAKEHNFNILNASSSLDELTKDIITLIEA